MKKIVLCKHCKYCKCNHLFSYNFVDCISEENIASQDVVTGKKSYYSCRTVRRGDSKDCPNFKPKWWVKLLNIYRTPRKFQLD